MDDEEYGYDSCDKCFLLAPVPGPPDGLRKHGWIRVHQRLWARLDTLPDPMYPIRGKVHTLCPRCAQEWKEDNSLASIIE